MKKRNIILTIEQSNLLKIIAVIIVVISHWYRFYDTQSSLSFIKSTGVFGASLFAFLSGYGVEKSYKNKGIYSNWLIKRISKVYTPFIIVNLLSLIIYTPCGIRGTVLHIILGCKDGVMWYIPFIIAFYFVFYISSKISKQHRLLLLLIVSIMYTIICFVLKIASQWYTSIAALLLGVIIGNHKEVRAGYFSLFVGGVVTLFTAIGSRLFNNTLLIDLSTIISCAAFCYIAFVSLGLISSNPKHKVISIFSSSTFWLYLCHMKVLVLHKWHLLLSYLFISVLISIGMYVIYSYFEKKIFQILKEGRNT